MGFWDTVFKVGKEVFSEAADTTKQVSSHAKELKNASDDKLLRIVNNSSWNADGKEKMAAKGILRKRGYSEVVFRILCHFVKLSKKEMTYDQNQFRHGCRFKAVA